jgi:peroxiredoxin
MTLQSELDAVLEAWRTRVGPDNVELIANDIARLGASGILARAVKAGDRLPTALLLDAHSRPFDLATVFDRGPAIIVFYRGGWCPYCNLELRGYQALQAEIAAAGGSLVAISPELPDHSLSTAQKNELTFPVLSDAGGAFAQALGLRFALSDAVRPYYEKNGLMLPERNGDGQWHLPIPATLVVARDGTVAKAFVEPDYRKRAEPQAALDELRKLAAHILG